MFFVGSSLSRKVKLVGSVRQITDGLCDSHFYIMGVVLTFHGVLFSVLVGELNNGVFAPLTFYLAVFYVNYCSIGVHPMLHDAITFEGFVCTGQENS